MLNRRSFLKLAGLAPFAPAIPGLQRTPNDLERIVAGSKSLDFLGRPRSWSLVREGFHPIPPERVVVMTQTGYTRNRSEEDALRATLTDSAKLHSACVGKPVWPVGDDDGQGCKVCRYPLSVNLPREKLTLIFRLMRVLTDYYREPHLYRKWVTGCAKRESLASTGFGCGFAMPHQFQGDGLIQLGNPPTDWWLIISPEGINWNAIDDDPVFAMITHVFPIRHNELPGLSFRTWALTEGVAWGMKTDNWQRIAKMDRMDAARAVNREILRTVAITVNKCPNSY